MVGYNSKAEMMRLFSFLLIQFIFLLPVQSQESPNPDRVQEPTLYVILPTEIRPRAMQQILGKNCPGVQIKVFPRFTEFRDKTKEDPPDAVLALRAVADVTRAFLSDKPDIEEGSFAVGMRGHKDGADEEEYVLLSEKDISQKKIGEMTIGVVNIMSRGDMPGYLEKKLGEKPRIKTVSKLEDLLSPVTVLLRRRHLHSQIQDRILQEQVQTGFEDPIRAGQGRPAGSFDQQEPTGQGQSHRRGAG